MSFLDELGHDSVAPTPMSDRSMGFFNTFALWSACAVVITVVMIGTLLIPSLTPLEAVAIMVSATLFGAIPIVLVGKIGTRTGLPTMVLLRAVFGQKGAAIPAVINGFIWIGWSWIQAYMAGFSLNYAAEHTFGYSNINLFVTITGVLVTCIALYGHRGIEKMENVVSILMLLMSGAVFIKLFTTYDVEALITLQAAENPVITKVIAFDIVVGLAYTWIASVCDYNRNCKSEKIGVWGTYIGYCLATCVAMGLGICVAAFSMLAGMEITYDPTVLLANSGFGPIAAIVVFLSVLSTNVMGLYTITFSFMCAIRNITFWKLCFFAGIVTILGALLKEVLLTYLMDYVLLIGFLFIPMFSMLLVDFFILHKGKYDAEDLAFNSKGHYEFNGGFNWFAIFCYAICAYGSYYFTYISPLPITTTVASFVASGVVYYVGMKVFHPNRSHSEEEGLEAF